MKYQTKELINEFGDKAIMVAKLVLEECPSKYYWDTFDDEQNSAITYWEEIINELEDYNQNKFKI